MKKILFAFGCSVLFFNAQGQVLVSGGSYSQLFDTLNTNMAVQSSWTDNSTLVGWYVQSTNTTVVVTDIRADAGGVNSGDLYSYGPTASVERAIGSIASGTSGTIGIGLRIQNDTATPYTGFNLSYTGEQWRNGGNGTMVPNSLDFSYRTSGSAITSPDVPNANSWTPFPALTFITPQVGATATALDGNAALNRTMLAATLAGVTLNPGEELFVRWIDVNDIGNDHGMGIDELTLTFSAVPEPQSLFFLGGVGLLFWRLFRRRS